MLNDVVVVVMGYIILNSKSLTTPALTRHPSTEGNEWNNPKL
jgi:hypothetical protein